MLVQAKLCLKRCYQIRIELCFFLLHTMLLEFAACTCIVPSMTQSNPIESKNAKTNIDFFIRISHGFCGGSKL